MELEAKLAPIIQQKFHLDTAYCDVHTAVTPWQYCDRDARVPGAAIRYADEAGNLLDTSAAVASGAYRRSQVRTEYSNGMVVTVNGHPTQTWKTPDGELPPNGWAVRGGRAGRLVAWSKLIDAHRADYVDSPAYVYADGRGRLTRFDQAACDGQLIAHKRPDGTMEVIPVGRCTVFGVSLDGRTAAAVALDEEGRTLGPAETRFSRGLVYVTPVPKAFSCAIRSRSCMVR